MLEINLRSNAPVYPATTRGICVLIFVILVLGQQSMAGSGLKLYTGRIPGTSPNTENVKFAVDGRSVVYEQGSVLYGMQMSTGVPRAISSGVIYEYDMSSDGRTLVYALGSHNSDQDIYSVSLDTMVQTDLNLSIYNYDKRFEVLMPDGSGLVYYNQDNQLMLIPITGGEGRVISENVSWSHYLNVSPDSSQIIYQNYSNHMGAIVSIPKVGGDEVEMPSSSVQLIHAVFTPDGSHLITARMEIYALDGSARAWQPKEWRFQGLDYLSPDKANIVYTDRAYDASRKVWRPRNIYSIPFDGSGSEVKIFPDVGADEFVDYFAITPDSQSVIIRGDPYSEGVGNLYRSPITGGTPSKLNAPIAEGTEVDFVGFAGNQDLVYFAQATGDSARNLYHAPLAGGPPTLIPTPGLTLQSNATLTPDKQIVLFIGTDLEGLHNLYAVPLSGGGVVPMSVPFSDYYLSIDLSEMSFSPDGERAIFMVRTDDYHNFREYSVVGVPLSMVESGAGISGSITGGAGFIGGIDYHYENVTTGGIMKVVYESLSPDMIDPVLLSSIDFHLTGDTIQYWDIALDGIYEGIVTLTLTYDETLLGLGVSESMLQIQHQKPDGSFELLPVLGRDPLNNTITVQTDGFSHFVLAVPEPGSVVLIGSLIGPCVLRRRARVSVAA